MHAKEGLAALGRLADERGQSTVEAAFLLPVVFVAGSIGPALRASGSGNSRSAAGTREGRRERVDVGVIPSAEHMAH